MKIVKKSLLQVKPGEIVLARNDSHKRDFERYKNREVFFGE